MNPTNEKAIDQEDLERQQAIEHLRELIRDIPVAMLTTLSPDGSLQSRPMVNINERFDGQLWFFTHRDDPKVAEIVSTGQVNAAFSDPQKHRFVSASGTATIVRDEKRLEMYWSEACEPWFPKGLEDEKLALLCIDVAFAEYWDQQLGSMVAIAGLLKRLATGSKYQTIDSEKMEWKSRGDS